MQGLKKLDRTDFRPEFGTPVQDEVLYVIDGYLVNALREDLGFAQKSRWLLEELVNLGTPKAESKECRSESA